MADVTQDKSAGIKDGVRDADELAEGDLARVLAGHLAQLAQRLQEVYAPVPQGLAEGDAAAVKLRRAELGQKAAFLHGTTLGVASYARAARLLSYEAYAAHVLAVQQLTR